MYALIGTAFTLTYRLGRVFNFAVGDLVSLAIYALLLVAGGGGAAALTGIGGPQLAAGAAAALVVAGGAVVVIQWRLSTPFAARGLPVGWVAGTAAAGFLIESLVLLAFPAQSYTVPDVLHADALPGGGVIRLGGGGVLQARDILVLLAALAIAIALDRWMAASRTGRAMRAAAEDLEAARICGVSAARVQLITAALGGLLLGAAGLLLAPERPVTISLGVVLGLQGVAAAVLGRLGSARGALVAGLALGLLESALGTAATPALGAGPLRVPALGPAPELHDLLPLLLLLAALTWRPATFAGAQPVVE